MEKENLRFKIGLSGSSNRKQPEFVIKIDDEKLVHRKLTQSPNTVEYFEFEHTITEGPHLLKIELINKAFGDTVLDSEGNIIEDLLLNIESIEIDDIDLGALKWTLSVYEPKYPERYEREQNRQGKALPKQVQNCVNLGWNGVWQLPIESPFYIWLLEKI